MSSTTSTHLHGLDVGLQLSLLSLEGSGLGRKLVDAVVGVGQFVFSGLASTVGLKEKNKHTCHLFAGIICVPSVSQVLNECLAPRNIRLHETLV